MPVITNIGNLQFVLTAIAGGILSLSGLAGLTPLGLDCLLISDYKSF